MQTSNVQASAMSELLSFRAEDGSSKRAEALAKELAGEPIFAGLNLTRSRILSMALARGLTELEREFQSKKGRKK